MLTGRAEPDDSLAMENKAVVDYGPQRPSQECTKIDLLSQLAGNLEPVPIQLHWMAGHQVIKASHTKKPTRQKADIKRNRKVASP